MDAQRRFGWCGLLLVVGISGVAFCQEEMKAEVIFIDARSTFVIFDKGVVHGVNVGSEICLGDPKGGKPLFCGKVISSVEKRSGYYVPPALLARLRPGHGAVVTVALAEPVPPFADAIAAAALLREKQKYIFREEDAASGVKWNDADPFTAEKAGETEFFSSLSNPGGKPAGGSVKEVDYQLKEGISGAYLYSAATPFTLGQIRFHSPAPSTSGDEGLLWNKYKTVSSSAAGALGRYTAPDRGGYNLAYDIYARLMLWDEDTESFSPADKSSYVQTDETAWSAGGAVRVRYNQLSYGRLRINPSAGLFVDRASLLFVAKSVTGTGATDTFAKLQEELYTIGLTGSLQATALFKPVELFAEWNVTLPLASMKSSTQTARMPQPGGVTYASTLGNDIKQAVNLKKSSLGMEMLFGFNYDFDH